MFRKIGLALTAVVLFSSLQYANSQTPRITWNGTIVMNNSLLAFSTVQSRLNAISLAQHPLVCQGIAGAWWYQANGAMISLATDSFSQPRGLGQQKVSEGVELYCGTSSFVPHGVQCCTNTTITLCIGMYTDLTLAASANLTTLNSYNYALSLAATYGPNITGGVQFELLTPTNVDPPVFRLTCTSTSSPPTDVLWTINGSSVSNSNAASSQIVSDQDRPTSTYKNTLIVTGRAHGIYACNVTTTCSPVCGGFTLNPRSAISSLNVHAPPGPPTGVIAVQSAPRNVSVSWTAPTSGGLVTRYDIYYVANGISSTSRFSTTSTFYAFSNLPVGVQYIFSVIAVGRYLGSQVSTVAVPGPVVITGNVTTPTAGSPYSLSCTVLVIGYNGVMTITLIAPSGRTLVSNVNASTGMTYTLQWPFPVLHTSDGGLYRCVVNQTNTALRTETLLVSVTIPPHTVTITAVPSYVAIAGSSLTLRCNIQFDPSVDSAVVVNIKWTKQEGGILSSSELKLTRSNYWSVLPLTSLGTGNAGNYSCGVFLVTPKTQYITGQIETKATILVSVHTMSISTSGSLVTGQIFTLMCKGQIVGNTSLNPTVMWYNSTGVVTSGNGITIFNGILTFNPLHTSHGGQYICHSTLSSPFSTATEATSITVQIPPPTVTITSTPITTSYYAGMPLNLTCTVQFIPQVDVPIIVTWLRGLSIVTTDSYTTISPLIRIGSSYLTTLIFNSLSTADSGQYKCNISVPPGASYVILGVGGDFLSLQVLELPTPSVTIIPSLPQPSYGVAYSLMCQASVVADLVLPIGLTWSRADGLNLGTTPVINGSTITLSFPLWSTLNLAEYNCTAIFSLPLKGTLASSTASISLQVPGVINGPVLATPSDSTVVISWSTPKQTNRVLIGYSLSVVQLLDYGMPVIGSAKNTTVDAKVTSYIWNGLNSGTPYQTCVSAMNALGPGDPWCKVFFTKEEVPSIAPVGVVGTRSSDGLNMSISWSPLTLSQARGFVDYYAISYGPVGDYSIQLKTATITGTYVVASGLNATLTYSVTTSGHTSAGLGPSTATVVFSSAPTAAGLATHTAVSGSSISIALIAAIIGGVVFGILAVGTLVVIIIAFSRYSKKGTHDLRNEYFAAVSQLTKKQQIELINVDVSEEAVTSAAALKGEGSRMNTGKELHPPQAAKNKYEPSGAKHHTTLPISVTSFHEHVYNMHTNRNQGFEQEFELLQVWPGRPQTVAALACNVSKNTTANVLPYDDDRVKLKEIPGVPGSDFINASYIDGYKCENCYIASQGPTVNTIADFWRMVWEGRLQTIVMLAKCTEGSKHDCCEMYWSDSMGSVYEIDTLTVTTISILLFADFDIRKFSIKNKMAPDTDPLQVTHFHFTAWPDHGVPQFATSILNFLRRVQNSHNKGKGVPLLVHCSAGVGRTGTFIALDILLDSMRSETSISVFDVVNDMRRRRTLMVQTLDQYMFIHDAADEYTTCRDIGISVTNLRIFINSLSRNKSGKMTNGFQEQFSLLDMLSRKPTPDECSDGAEPFNKTKNRYENILPYDISRPFLRITDTEDSDYINASFVDGYQQRKGYIATQGPLQNTVEDFWRMVWEYECRVIIMLCDLIEEGCESSYCYWPTEEGSAVSYGNISVILESTQSHDAYNARRFIVTDKRCNTDATVVTQLHYTEWPKNGRPTNTASMVRLIDTLTRMQISTGNKPIIVHCNDGVGRTGTFITLHCELERLKAEGIVDVFQRVKISRIARPGLVQNVEQYVYCLECLVQYVDGFDAYANFKESV